MAFPSGLSWRTQGLRYLSAWLMNHLRAKRGLGRNCTFCEGIFSALSARRMREMVWLRLPRNNIRRKKRTFNVNLLRRIRCSTLMDAPSWNAANSLVSVSWGWYRKHDTNESWIKVEGNKLKIIWPAFLSTLVIEKNHCVILGTYRCAVWRNHVGHCVNFNGFTCFDPNL